MLLAKSSLPARPRQQAVSKANRAIVRRGFENGLGKMLTGLEAMSQGFLFTVAEDLVYHQIL